MPGINLNLLITLCVQPHRSVLRCVQTRSLRCHAGMVSPAHTPMSSTLTQHAASCCSLSLTSLCARAVGQRGRRHRPLRSQHVALGDGDQQADPGVARRHRLPQHRSVHPHIMRNAGWKGRPQCTPGNGCCMNRTCTAWFAFGYLAIAVSAECFLLVRMLQCVLLHRHGKRWSDTALGLISFPVTLQARGCALCTSSTAMLRRCSCAYRQTTTPAASPSASSSHVRACLYVPSRAWLTRSVGTMLPKP